MIRTTINTVMGFTVSILAYKEHISTLVAMLTAIYLIVQMTISILKYINRNDKAQR